MAYSTKREPRTEALKHLSPKEVAAIDRGGFRFVFGRMQPDARKASIGAIGARKTQCLQREGISLHVPRSANSAQDVAAAAHAYTSAEEARLDAIRSGSKEEARRASVRSASALRELEGSIAPSSHVGTALGAAAGAAAGALVGPVAAAAGGVVGALVGSRLAGRSGGSSEPEARSEPPRTTALARRHNLANRLKR